MTKNKKKLTFKALPKFAHGRNLRKVSPWIWKQIRTGLLVKGCQCEICGATPISEYDQRNFHAHEDWEFDIKNHILILKHIGIICSKCHQTEHMGLLQIKLQNGQITEEEFDAVFEHYATVNHCPIEIAYSDYRKSILDYRSNPDNYSQKLVDANWTYRLDCDFPAKDKMRDALMKKGLLADAQ